MVDFEITKTQKILEIKNILTHEYYFLFCGKIHNKNKTKTKKFLYIERFNIFELQEYYEKNNITKKEIEAYVENLIDNMGVSYIQDIENFNDKKGLKEFYNYCNETVQNFNKY